MGISDRKAPEPERPVTPDVEEFDLLRALVWVLIIAGLAAFWWVVGQLLLWR